MLRDETTERCLGDICLDVARGRLSGPAGTVALEPRITALLRALMATPDCVCSRTELLAAVWTDRVVSAGAVHVAVAELRRALLACGSVRLQLTWPRRGYELRCLPAERADVVIGAGTAESRCAAETFRPEEPLRPSEPIHAGEPAHPSLHPLVATPVPARRRWLDEGY